MTAPENVLAAQHRPRLAGNVSVNARRNANRGTGTALQLALLFNGPVQGIPP